MEPKKHYLELGIEFCLELAIGLYQLGAEQMDLPHNFWVGLVLWIAATALALRMLWIFPGIERLNPKLKVAIASVAVALLVFTTRTPVTSAYKKAKAHDLSAHEMPADQQQDAKPSEAKPEDKKPTDEKKDAPLVKKNNRKKQNLQPKEESAQPPSTTAARPPQPNVTVNHAPNGIANSGTIQGNVTVNNIGTSRTITPKAAAEIRIGLSGFPKLPVLVSPVPGDGEETNLVYRLEDALSGAGLDVGGGVAHYIGANTVVGVLICPRLNPQDVKAAQILADILNRNGVDASVNLGIAPPPAIPGYTNILVGSIPPKQ
jgi:hypothetical protein